MTTATMPRLPQVALEYVIEAPPEAVFDVWTDADALMQWWCPGAYHATHVHLDARVGGRYEIRMAAPGHEGEHIVRGEYVALDRPRLLAMTWRAQGTPHDNNENCLLTVQLHEHPRGTRLALLHEQLPVGSEGSYGQGWAQVLQQLARHCGEAAAGHR